VHAPIINPQTDKTCVHAHAVVIMHPPRLKQHGHVCTWCLHQATVPTIDTMTFRLCQVRGRNRAINDSTAAQARALVMRQLS